MGSEPESHPPQPSPTERVKSDPPAFQRVFGQVYGQLRAMAQDQMNRERRSHTLHATELVHQAYVRLSTGSPADYSDKGQFMRAAAEAMRRILIEHARSRARQKRGGDRDRVTLSLVDVALPEDSNDLLALDEALRRLEEKDARAGEVVRLRFFAGLTIEQTAEAMGLSARTVKREWEFARAWLSQSLQ